MVGSSSLSAETVLPCLLDRLCDDDPENAQAFEGPESFTLARYRQSVMRDLGHLLNSTTHPNAESLEEFPEVFNSVLNFGPPDLTGKNIDAMSKAELENSIRETILKFEPRIFPESLVVSLLPEVKQGTPNVVEFEISALLWSNPMPERFLIKSQIDLDTGLCEF